MINRLENTIPLEWLPWYVKRSVILSTVMILSVFASAPVVADHDVTDQETDNVDLSQYGGDTKWVVHDDGTVFYAIENTTTTTPTIVAVNESSAQVEWTKRVSRYVGDNNRSQAGIVADGKVFVGLSSTGLVILDRDNGNLVDYKKDRGGSQYLDRHGSNIAVGAYGVRTAVYDVNGTFRWSKLSSATDVTLTDDVLVIQQPNDRFSSYDIDTGNNYFNTKTYQDAGGVEATDDGNVFVAYENSTEWRMTELSDLRTSDPIEDSELPGTYNDLEIVENKSDGVYVKYNYSGTLFFNGSHINKYPNFDAESVATSPSGDAVSTTDTVLYTTDRLSSTVWSSTGSFSFEKNSIAMSDDAVYPADGSFLQRAKNVINSPGVVDANPEWTWDGGDFGRYHADLIPTEAGVLSNSGRPVLLNENGSVVWEKNTSRYNTSGTGALPADSYKDRFVFMKANSSSTIIYELHENGTELSYTAVGERLSYYADGIAYGPDGTIHATAEEYSAGGFPYLKYIQVDDGQVVVNKTIDSDDRGDFNSTATPEIVAAHNDSAHIVYSRNNNPNDQYATGNVTVAHVNDSGVMESVTGLGEYVYDNPAADGKYVVESDPDLGNGETVTMFDIDSMSIDWMRNFSGASPGSVVTMGRDRVYVGAYASDSNPQVFYSLDKEDGELLWTINKSDMPREWERSVTSINPVSGGIVGQQTERAYIPDHRGYLHVIAKNGTHVKSIEVLSTPDADWYQHFRLSSRGDTVYYQATDIGDDPNQWRVYALDIDENMQYANETGKLGKTGHYMNVPPINQNNTTPAGGQGSLLPVFLGSVGPVPFWLIGVLGAGVAGAFLYMRRDEVVEYI